MKSGQFNGTGADCSGSSGEADRVLTLSNTGATSQNGFLVYVSGLALALTTEYTVSHKNSSTEITFLNPLWDDMTIVISYYEGTPAESDTDTRLTRALDRTMELAGTQLRIRYFTETIGSVWDDETTLAQSGNSTWVSGVVFPIRGREGSTESLLLKQGKLLDSDKKVFVNGSIAFTGSIYGVDVQLGSPTGDLYSVIPDGGEMWEISSTPIYKKQFLRRLTGSLT